MSDNIVLAKEYQRPLFTNQGEITETVTSILKDIETKGAEAVDAWSQKIDGRKPSFIALKSFEDYELTPDLKKTIYMSYQRIKKFCEFQMRGCINDHFVDEFGTYGHLYQPIERIGAYIPGGNFPLISTAMMTLTPAQVAGCPVRIACSPSLNPALLAAASLAGATAFLHIGGAQAIGALAYGYQDMAAVNMIVGPGNAYVNQAKSYVQGRTKIDTLAGPSELLIYATHLENPEWIVLDALAQAEHDRHAISLVVSPVLETLQQVEETLLSNEQGRDVLESKNIVLILAENDAEAIRFINDYAPEHLMICDLDLDRSLLTNYGSLFIGENSAVAFGDYCSGPNHTLPTGAAAKFSGGLSVHPFLKVLSHQKINELGRTELGRLSAVMAQAEGLLFHQKSAECRF